MDRSLDGDLPFDQRHDVRRMQAVAHLVTLAAEPDVAQRTPTQPAVDPIGEDALIGAAELAGAGEHAAPVHPDGETEGRAVFERQLLARQLGRAVQRNRWRRGERFVDALRASGPAGSGPRSSGSNASFATRTGSAASGGME